MCQQDSRQEAFQLREWTLGQILDHVVSRFPEREAMIYPERNYRQTWREFAALVDRLARGLMAIGIGKGEKVAIWATNVPYWVALQFATARIGAILLTMNTNYRDREIRYQLEQSECENIFLIEGQREYSYLEVIYRLLPELRTMPRGQQGFAELPNMRRVCFLGDQEQEGMYSMPEILELGKSVTDAEYESRKAEVRPWDVVNIQYTSGTTGLPKGAMLTHVGIGLNAYWIGRNMRVTENDKLCLTVPLFHCFGCVLGTLVCANHGAAMVILESFNTTNVLKAVDSERCTILHGVPTMFLAELEHRNFKKYDVSCLRTGVMGGALCPEVLMRRVMNELHIPEITICYGQTEVSPVMTQTDIHDSLPQRCQTVGKAMPGVEVKIIDPASGRELPRGQEGEIVSRGYNTMHGYYNKPEKTALKIDKDGWLHSEDLGTMDEDGYVRVTGRIKDIIIRGGENISPKEIEVCLLDLEGIIDAQVVSVPSRKYGEEVGAFIQLREGATVTEKDVRNHCRGKLAMFKIPRYVHFVDSYPLTASGKIQKFRLREMAAELWPER